MAKGRPRRKSDKNVAKGVTDNQKGGTAKDNTLVSLSTLAKGPLASQDKRTNEDESTHNAGKEKNINDTSTIISMSHKKGKLKQERYVLIIM